jgi:hypothetical protein
MVSHSSRPSPKGFEVVSRPSPKSSQNIVARNRESEDLIQRVSDIKLGGSSASAADVRKRRNLVSSVQTTSLGILLRDRLDNEGIRLSAPPFNSKVGKERRKEKE